MHACLHHLEDLFVTSEGHLSDYALSRLHDRKLRLYHWVAEYLHVLGMDKLRDINAWGFTQIAQRPERVRLYLRFKEIAALF